MREILKNMLRRRTRTLLTVFGIMIGIFAFTVMGSMAEKISLLVQGGEEYYADKVIVSQGESLFISSPMDISKADDIEAVDGVVAAIPSVYTTLDESFDAINFGPPASIVSADFEAGELETFEITFQSGRDLEPGEDGKVVVGSDLVKTLDAEVGGTVLIRGDKYEVVGIMNKTLTAPDNSVVLTLADAQKIYYDELPEIVQEQTKSEDLVNGFTVYVEDGRDPDTMAGIINDEVDGVNATGPQAFQDQIASATGVFNAILFGVALISLLVGGLSVINTMTMSIAERTREIGIKKAVGARTRNIMGEYLGEAGLIGLLGGLLGWGIGAITVLGLNAAMAASGNTIFLLTPRISIFAIAFATALGVIAGIYPAYYAAKLNVVKALREE